jgi:TRAP-type C4-dicarboxylate transport system substrate-binding protein
MRPNGRSKPRTRAVLALALAATLVAGLLAGCGAGRSEGAADKAGGSGAPVVLRLASPWPQGQPDTPVLEYFAAQVSQLSGGRMRIQLIFDALGQSRPDVEPRVAGFVRDGRFDLGWIGARAWDELGVTSFQALQAPFLITDYTLLKRVVTSSLARRMIAGLKGARVVGLALIPDLLRYPDTARRPLVSAADFRGVRLRVFPSKATDMLLRALGATPEHVSGSAINAEIASGRIDGSETSLPLAPPHSIITGNVPLFPRVNTLFVNPTVLAKLTSDERSVLRAAAARTLAHVLRRPLSTAVMARQFCRGGGRIVLANATELAALERAARPVYSQLERIAETRNLIASIRALKASLPASVSVVPAGCATTPVDSASTGKVRSPSILNGTYRFVYTRADALAFGPPASDPENLKALPAASTWTLRDGKFLGGGDPPEVGTYSVTGNRVAFHDSQFAYALIFTFRVDHSGTLHLTPVLPMDRGDQFVWSVRPWRRIGPPVRKIS